MRRLLIVVLLVLAVVFSVMSQPGTVAAGPDGTAQITLADGKRITIPKEPGQTGIREIRIAPDETVGWLAEYRVEAVRDPVAGTLVLWRAGKVIRRFTADQSFYSWAFYAQGKQVAYHVGPLHGESKSHCELHDARSGRLIGMWDGELDSEGTRPAWTKVLTH